MKIPLENILKVEIHGNQSDEELLTFIQAKQDKAPIWQLACYIFHDKEFGIEHPLVSFIRSTPTLKHVEFWSKINDGYASIDAFLDATSQNPSIHTVKLYNIKCSAIVAEKLMQRKIQFKVCRVQCIGHLSHRNGYEYTCNVEELEIVKHDPHFIDFLLNFKSWPLLCRLTIEGYMFTTFPYPLGSNQADLHVEHVIGGAPILQEFKVSEYTFWNPAVLQSCATAVFNAPSPDLKWHLDNCLIHPGMMTVFEEIIKHEKAKLMWVSLRTLSLKNQFCILRTIMCQSSCHLGDLDVTYVDEHGHSCRVLTLLSILTKQTFTCAYPRTLIHLVMDLAEDSKLCRNVIKSIPHWTPRVKKLVFDYELSWLCSSDQPLFYRKLLTAVYNNLHLQSVEKANYDDDDDHDDEDNNEKSKNADEEMFFASLERYCERNRDLEAALGKADTIPLELWPYILRLVSRGGADMLYRHVRENAGCILKGFQHCPPNMQAKSKLAPTRSQPSRAAKQKRA